MRTAIALLILSVLAGCSSTGVTEADQAAVQKEFSKENYEKAMIESGKGAELEAEKKREAEFLKGNAAGGQEAGQN